MKLLVLKAGEVFIHDKSGTDNLTFLFNQVVHQHLRYPEHDPWSYLTGRILELATTVAELEALNVSMGTATHGVVLSYWTMKYLTDRFTSGSGLNQSMLDKFAASVTLYTLLGGEGHFFVWPLTWPRRCSSLLLVYWTIVASWTSRGCSSCFEGGIGHLLLLWRIVSWRIHWHQS
ncbi:uncharacterized protein LOC9636978 [Selaginella moellendorffii]|uniref:uncharacterized protein LOC9636978 n=1 Tax=Selaginella moellendorffii TaxID=88036 RepID=UPI000D1CC406|nr:uncharacterized protein LOC9636978 [Selaginella moellendorffii]|eukprot:XP_024533585.1 uncharacterized protein LOC9636978 [Selaginella moellendorffii]